MNSSVLTIAGYDPSEAAGIHADVATFNEFHLPNLSIHTDASTLPNQLAALKKTTPPLAIKMGALGAAKNVGTVWAYLENNSAPLVYDPALQSTAGGSLVEKKGYADILNKLLPNVTLFTPNLIEACALLNTEINSIYEIPKLAQLFLTLGCQAVLIKGGHWPGSLVHDFFSNGQQSFWLTTPRINKEVRGTGCHLSAAIAAGLAKGEALFEALVRARFYLHTKIRTAVPFTMATHKILTTPQTPIHADFPWLTSTPQHQHNPFPTCGPSPLGPYAIVDNVPWLAHVLQHQINTVQLRLKNQPFNKIEQAVIDSVALAKKYGARLFINDYWKLAIKHRAYGVHLGQEDLLTADLAHIYASGLRLGISTHCDYEIACAHAVNPSYMAYGPIFPTTTKAMKFTPRGIHRLREYCELLDYSIVAIGGIHHSNYQQVHDAGANGLAMVSAVRNLDEQPLFCR